jgi:hypothetical protein
MGKWLTAARFEDVGEIAGDGKWAKLLEPLRYHDDSGRIHEVPAGFRTDFASIPRVLWSLVGGPAEGKYRRAAVLHDYLYALAGSTGITRAECDRLFHEVMLASGVGRVTAWTLYAGVRAGGWVTWAQYEKKYSQNKNFV